MDMERRHFIRCRVDELVAVRLIAEQGGREAHGRLVDISTGGVQVLGPAEEFGAAIVDPGQITTVRITHAGRTFEADATAKRLVEHTAEGVVLGLAFTHLDEAHVERLQHFLDVLWDSCKVGGIRLEEKGAATTAYVVGAMAPSVCVDLCTLICAGQIHTIDLTACLQISREGARMIGHARRLGLRVDNCHAEIAVVSEGPGDAEPLCGGCPLEQGRDEAPAVCRVSRIGRRPG